ncbi:MULTISPECIES: DUF2844 domain-containing protein [Burkholderia]|uniref:DUF2844 domain-containing protein n=1 Tax=Burkholderia sp. M701 TaxID=326454 RepID=V5YNP8_9BURK|nr:MULTISPECIES: DUF2844 domain-containing protein [Burkholderia]BAO19017.1 protein of unknown function DUF2844 [Burkholderia sp. M701]
MKKITRAISAGMAALAFSMSAYAALGGNAATASADAAAMNGALTTTQKAGYSIDQFTTPANTRVREYIAPNGIVFGVTWKGPQLPDLSQLLGAYSASIKNQVTVSRRLGVGISAASVQADGAEMFSAGHMGHFRGRAYLPASVPAGVTEKIIR